MRIVFLKPFPQQYEAADNKKVDFSSKTGKERNRGTEREALAKGWSMVHCFWQSLAAELGKN